MDSKLINSLSRLRFHLQLGAEDKLFEWQYDNLEINIGWIFMSILFIKLIQLFRFLNSRIVMFDFKYK